MSSREEIIQYVTSTPTNTNPNVLLTMLEEGSGGVEQIQTDWEQNDSTKKDFLKNKPFYSNEKIKEIEDTYPVEFCNLKNFYLQSNFIVKDDLSSYSFEETTLGTPILNSGFYVLSNEEYQEIVNQAKQDYEEDPEEYTNFDDYFYCKIFYNDPIVTGSFNPSKIVQYIKENNNDNKYNFTFKINNKIYSSSNYGFYQTEILNEPTLIIGNTKYCPITSLLNINQINNDDFCILLYLSEEYLQGGFYFCGKENSFTLEEQEQIEYLMQLIEEEKTEEATEYYNTFSEVLKNKLPIKSNFEERIEKSTIEFYLEKITYKEIKYIDKDVLGQVDWHNEKENSIKLLNAPFGELRRDLLWKDIGYAITGDLNKDTCSSIKFITYDEEIIEKQLASAMFKFKLSPFNNPLSPINKLLRAKNGTIYVYGYLKDKEVYYEITDFANMLVEDLGVAGTILGRIYGKEKENYGGWSLVEKGKAIFSISESSGNGVNDDFLEMALEINLHDYYTDEEIREIRQRSFNEDYAFAVTYAGEYYSGLLSSDVDFSFVTPNDIKQSNFYEDNKNDISYVKNTPYAHSGSLSSGYFYEYIGGGWQNYQKRSISDVMITNTNTVIFNPNNEKYIDGYYYYYTIVGNNNPRLPYYKIEINNLKEITLYNLNKTQKYKKLIALGENLFLPAFKEFESGSWGIGQCLKEISYIEPATSSNNLAIIIFNNCLYCMYRSETKITEPVEIELKLTKAEYYDFSGGLKEDLDNLYAKDMATQTIPGLIRKMPSISNTTQTDYPTAQEYNNLLQALRDAGIMEV